MTTKICDNGLTAKQDAFAVAVVETGNAAEAYRRAYDVDESSRDEWIYVEACQLLDHPKVSQRVSELREQADRQAVAHALYTRQKAMDELEDARTTAKAQGQASAMVGATSAKIKLAGLDRPKRLELTNPDGSLSQPAVLPLAALSDEELEQLERLTDKARNSEGMGETE